MRLPAEPSQLESVLGFPFIQLRRLKKTIQLIQQLTEVRNALLPAADQVSALGAVLEQAHQHPTLMILSPKEHGEHLDFSLLRAWTKPNTPQDPEPDGEGQAEDRNNTLRGRERWPTVQRQQ